ncbi:MAG: Na+/H+ antiporter NhaC family protein [Planctomycetota bacterium]|jgi:Na+/H+ antiporter NhaC
MTGRWRYVLAAFFVALFFLIPGADHRYLAFLQTRSWLSGDDSPLLALRDGQILILFAGEAKPVPLERSGLIPKKPGPVELPAGAGVAVFRKGVLEHLAEPPRLRLRQETRTEKLVLEIQRGDEFMPLQYERVAPLRVDIKPAVFVADYKRILREWTRGQGLTIDNRLAPARLQVYAAETAVQATLSVTTDSGQGQIARRVVPAAAEGGARDAGWAAGWSTRLAETWANSSTFFPDRWSLLPPFLAIVLAILTGKIIPSLLIGCFAGAFVLTRGPLLGAIHLFLNTIGREVLWEDFNLRIMGFVVFLFMTVGVMTRCGGVQGLVEWVRRYAKGPVSSQLCSYVIGLLIFFDDYTNCILTGTTMRPLTDRNRVSREKLSYIVDSTAAPIAGISLFSTWVAYEISQFAPQLPEVGMAANEGFLIFLQTLPVRFYCLFTLSLVLLTIVLRREFGSMLAAESRAATTGKPFEDDAQPMISRGFTRLEAPAGIAHLARNAVIPIGLLVVLTISLIYYIGHSNTPAEDLPGGFLERIRTVLSNTESELALVIASFTALIVAAVLAMGQKLLTPKQTVGSALRSARSLGFAVVILILAWSMGSTCEDVGTSFFLTAAFHGKFAPWLLPVVMFALASLVAFCTGTSYGTMAILLPNIVVLAHTMGEQPGAEYLGGPALMVLTIGAVLEGSIFGDHCSPISDTTVLSSVATGSDHLHHVRTQAPYAAFAMVVSMVCGYLPVALLGPGSWPLAWLLGISVLVLWLLVVGRRPG